MHEIRNEFLLTMKVSKVLRCSRNPVYGVSGGQENRLDVTVNAIRHQFYLQFAFRFFCQISLSLYTFNLLFWELTIYFVTICKRNYCFLQVIVILVYEFSCVLLITCSYISFLYKVEKVDSIQCVQMCSNVERKVRFSL